MGLMWESGMMEGAKTRRLGLLSSLRLDVWHGVDRSRSELAAGTTQHVRKRASSAASGMVNRRHKVDWLRTIQSNRWHQDVSATEARLTKWGEGQRLQRQVSGNRFRAVGAGGQAPPMTWLARVEFLWRITEPDLHRGFGNLCAD